MNLKEQHKVARQSYHTLVHELRLMYKKNIKKIFAVVEGRNDPSFYRGVIENSLPNVDWEIKLYPVGGKGKVLGLKRNIDWTEFQRNQILFFVDRDFQDFGVGPVAPIEEDLYITTGYSIENDLINKRLLEDILKDIKSLDKISDEEFGNVYTNYLCARSQFLDIFVEVVCWGLIWKRNGLEPILNNAKVKKIVSVKSNGTCLLNLDSKYSNIKEYLEDKCDVDTSAQINFNYQAVESEVKANDLAKVMRGKYLLEFTLLFLEQVHKDCVSYCSEYSSPPKVKVPIGEANSIVVLGPRCRPPQDLKMFLEKNIKKYESILKKNNGNWYDGLLSLFGRGDA